MIPTLVDGAPVLIVDDEESIRDATERILTRMGCRVFKAAHGEQGLEILAREEISLVLLDLKLPKVDGIEVLRKIKDSSTLKKVPVVILTTSKEEKDLVESYDLGVNSYIRKPVDFDQFVETVRYIGYYWLLLNESPKEG